ncbi:MAG: acetyl-CoA carboxylase biotin carboxylase subunit [Rubrobacter sp.]|nr:acetyl-CoA carboxylase biotin carboxylase subunit [Rubrobacter sp.]
MSIQKLLIANRGEVAVRIIRACKELGIRTVAVYSEADEGAMHVRLADEAYLLGPAESTGSYLNIERIVKIIVESGAEAVHPGYGFLSENADFARAVEETGATWVAPSAEAMEKVGDKIHAKELAKIAEVPTIPGYGGEEQDEERLAEAAEEIGYPVLIKASAGGGGRGMRPVHRAEDFLEALQSAKREAASAFGDDSMLLEKFVENPRHVEVQIIADDHGNVVHLYERECSIQRRHQKVVEEAPSPALPDELRESICDAAVRLAKEARYRNAGTVEFLLSGEEDEFYFLEMNARLQVEHPVTELVTGLDLVHLQLAVAAGEELPISQEDVFPRGSAIEVRIYTEEGTGLPAGGKLGLFAPSEGPGIRNDTGVETGDEVTLDYDPMIAKLIVFASDREKAVMRLRRALADYAILGVPTNLPLLRRIVDHPSFEAGEMTINFLEEHGLTEAPPAPSPPEEAVLIAAAGELSRSPTATPNDLFSVGPWRLGGEIRLRYRAGEEEHVVEAERSRSRTLKLRLNEQEAVAVEVLSVSDGEVRARIAERQVTGGFAMDDGDVLVSLDGKSYRLSKPAPPDVDDAGTGGGDDDGASLTAPMPGSVVKVLVSEGDEVEEGQLLLVLEAMKTEHSISAPHDGVVRSIPYGEGDSVPGGGVLVELEEA